MSGGKPASDERRQAMNGAGAIEISLRDARRFILGKQGLWPGRRFQGKDGTEQAMRACEHLQLDPLNVVGRAHDLILQARVVDYRPEYLDQIAYGERKFFDWGGWLAMRPMAELPYWSVVMERAIQSPSYRGWKKKHARAFEQVLADLREKGPLGNRDFVGGKSVTSYRGRKDTALALYHLWIQGEVMTHSRRRFERLYDLRERVAPAKFLGKTDAFEADLFLALKLIRFNGISNLRQLGQWVKREISVQELAKIERTLLAREQIVSVQKEGEKGLQWIVAEDLAALRTTQEDGVPSSWEPLVKDEVVFLSPLDHVSARGRAKKLFGFDYIWEVYKPLEKRRWGYYVLPILWGDQFVGRLDPVFDRASGQLKILGFWLEDERALRGNPEFKRAMQAGMARFMGYLGSSKVSVEGPGSAALKKLLRGL